MNEGTYSTQNDTCVCPMILEVWVMSASFFGFEGLPFDIFAPILVFDLWPLGIMDSSSVTKHTVTKLNAKRFTPWKRGSDFFHNMEPVYVCDRTLFVVCRLATKPVLGFDRYNPANFCP